MYYSPKGLSHGDFAADLLQFQSKSVNMLNNVLINMSKVLNI